MSRNVPAAVLAHLRGDVTSLSLCWRVQKRNGDLILGTDHDLDLTIDSGDLAGTYRAGVNITGSDVRSNSDMSVNNMEVQGALSENFFFLPDITQADIEAGTLNFAPVTMFFVNWRAPNDGQVYQQCGRLGQLEWDDRGHYKTEVRGLSQNLSQNLMQTYSDRCNVRRFGDERCKFNVASVTIVATVTAVTNRRVFTVSGITTQPVGYFAGGTLVGITGENTGFTRQIRIDDTGGVQGVLTLFEAYPVDVLLGDTFSMIPGCDRRLATCRDRWNNLPNYRGYGVFIPGTDALLRGNVGATST